VGHFDTTSITSSAPTTPDSWGILHVRSARSFVRGYDVLPTRKDINTTSAAVAEVIRDSTSSLSAPSTNHAERKGRVLDYGCGFEAGLEVSRARG
jgi:hypothetical protein